MDSSVFGFTVCAHLGQFNMMKFQETDFLGTPEHLQNVFKLAICSMTPFRVTPRYPRFPKEHKGCVNANILTCS